MLRDVLGMTGTKFGCGIAQCGACTVQIDGEPVRSCLLPVGSIGERKITTIEGIGATEAGRKIQKAWLDLEVVQCGYCQSGQIMSAAALLARTPDPKDSDIDAAMAGNICRCGTYVRIRAAIKASRPVGLKETRPMTQISSAPKLTRRTMLKATAAAGGGLILSLSIPRLNAALAAEPDADFAPNAFVRIDPDGKVTFTIPQVEMGQGIYTALSMILAEELDAPFEHVTAVAAPPNDKLYANPLLGFQVTGGSTSVRAFWKPMRIAGATARAMLVQAAAAKWSVDPLVLPDGERRGPSRRERRGRRLMASLCRRPPL